MQSRLASLAGWLISPPKWAVKAHKLAHSAWRGGHPYLADLISTAARVLTGIEIRPSARIGQNLTISHGVGVVIGETAEVGNDVCLMQGVTLGIRSPDDRGKPGRQHPLLGDRVFVGPGAALLGPITVGDDARIGANAVVLKDVPPGALAVGVPARILRAAARPTDHDRRRRLRRLPR